MNLTEVTDLSVIGTLFAFKIVCAGVLVKDKEFAGEKRFVPYINSRYLALAIFLVAGFLLMYFNGEAITRLFTDFTPTPEDIEKGITTTSRVFLERVPYFVFITFSLVMTVLCMIKRLSLIPVLGVMCCTYLMTELGWTNWVRFGIWLLVGFVIYFFYSYRHSHLHTADAASEA